ncbi:MAG TPA: hypothetical protein VGD98_06715 [Ktedonobacteraceae bacterium]
MKKASLFKTTSSWFLPGLIAGLVFLASALISGAVSTTVWAMPEAIARAVGMSVPADYSLALGPLLVGVAVHLAISLALGVLFVALTGRLRLRGWLLMLVAVIFGAAEPAVALWVVMHNLLPASTFNFFLDAIPLWGSVLGHSMYGLVLGLLLTFGPWAFAAKPQQSAGWQRAGE